MSESSRDSPSSEPTTGQGRVGLSSRRQPASTGEERGGGGHLNAQIHWRLRERGMPPDAAVVRAGGSGRVLSRRDNGSAFRGYAPAQDRTADGACRCARKGGEARAAVRRKTGSLRGPLAGLRAAPRLRPRGRKRKCFAGRTHCRPPRGAAPARVAARCCSPLLFGPPLRTGTGYAVAATFLFGLRDLAVLPVGQAGGG